jgi:hypothetical protein
LGRSGAAHRRAAMQDLTLYGLSRRALEIAFGLFMAAVALKYVIALLL